MGVLVCVQRMQLFSLHEMKTLNCRFESFQQQHWWRSAYPCHLQSLLNAWGERDMRRLKQTDCLNPNMSQCFKCCKVRQSELRAGQNPHSPSTITHASNAWKEEWEECVCVKLNNQQRACVGECVESASFSRSESQLHLLLSVCNIWKYLSVCNVWKRLLWL